MTTKIIPVNKEQEYHDCEMIFSFYYKNETNNFEVDETQEYKIFTTINEVELLNEALNIYQEDGFKEQYLLFSSEIDGSKVYPEFVPRLNKAKELGKELHALCKDEDSLVQLQEYVLETPPTYVDDFKINKKINAIIINGVTKEISGYEELKTYISELKKS